MTDETRGRVIGQRTCKVKGCQVDVNAHLPPTFFSLCAYILRSVSLHHFFQPLLPFIFSLPFWCLKTSQTTFSWNLVIKLIGNISVIIKPTLQLSDTSSLMWTQACTYTNYWQTEGTAFLAEDGHKKRTKNTLLLRSLVNHYKYFPVWWQNNKYMSKPPPHTAEFAEWLFDGDITV